MGKRLVLFVIFSLLLFSSFAGEGNRYRINSVTFDSREKTDPKMLLRKIGKIDEEKVFGSKEELDGYLAFIYQQMINTRLLENIEYSYTELKGKEADVTLVDVLYSFEDTSSLMIVPYPTYSSNSGLQVTLMMCDQNFLGKTNPFTAYANCTFGTEEEPDNFSKITPSLGVNYDFPFYVGPVTATWKNMIGMAWTIGDSMPEFNVSTGPYLAIPIGNQELDFSFVQTAVANKDFEKYGDDLFFNESARLSMPLKIATIGSATPLVYRPYLSASYTWDFDGIDDSNLRLSATPKLTAGQTTSVQAVDWKGNFRNGYSFSTTQAISRNFNEKELARGLIPYIDGNLKIFKGWKYAGIAANLHFFTMFNTEKDDSSLVNIGPWLRGALDKQTFAQGYDGMGDYNLALETEQAIMFSLEAPFHLLTTHFTNFLSAVNVELQLSPFIDVALMKNRTHKQGTHVGKIFDLKEGIYCAGIEGFIYPTRFKSYVLHANIGFDIGKYIIKDYKDDWRTAEKAFEISIGFGHHF